MDVDGNNVGDSPCDKVSEGVDLIKGERYRFYFRFVASGTVSIPSGNPEGFTSIVKLLSASSSGKLMCQIRVDYYNNK